MRRTASEVLRSLEMRVARLERQASDNEYIREYLLQNPHLSREEALEFMLEQGMDVGVKPAPSKIELTIGFKALNEKRFVKAVSDLGLPLSSSPRHKSGGAIYLHFTPVDFSKFWRQWLRRSPELIQKHGVTISQMYIYNESAFIHGEQKISDYVKSSLR
jgi:hypothetical protein